LRKKNRIHHFLTTKSLAKIPNLWAVSAFTRNLVQQQAGRSDIRILPNGLWTADWTLQNGKEDCRKLDGKPALLTVGRVSPRKGQHHVINALPELIQSFPGIHYHIVGIDGMKQPVVSTGEKLGVTDRVTFHGRVPSAGQLSKLYRSGDVLIMLSENQPDGEVEGFGIAILEANYFGIPAIGSKGCGIDDAISDGYNGVLVDGRNPAEVNEALKRIMGNYAQFSANAREWALRHDWHSLADGFLRKESQVFSKSDPTRQQKPAINQVHP
jgi:phosphatidylinositol alpha-1,6-mannosyltransferase